MKSILKQLPLYAVVGAMVLGGCSVVAEAPGPGNMGRERDRDRYERRDDRRDDWRDDRREDREGDRREGRRDDWRDDRRDDRRGGANVQINIGGYFGERQRAAVYEVYGQPPMRANCPPGLAKKNNGCQPPGQAKRWAMGQPLPRDIGYSPVEADVRVHLGVPPAGYEFVRVASDILMIAVGTGMVIDAIEDIQGRR